MRFPKYKVHGLVSQFTVRVLRSEFLEEPIERLLTWGRSAAYNSHRVLRIGNLPLNETEFSPWRQHVLHEVSYFNNRIQTYSNRWQKAYQRCYLALRKLKKPHAVGAYGLWQITAFCEAARHNINYHRISGRSRFHHIPVDWDDSYQLISWILRQKPLPANQNKSGWELTLTSINRDTFRKRRFKWDAAAKRAEENFVVSMITGSPAQMTWK